MHWLPSRPLQRSETVGAATTTGFGTDRTFAPKVPTSPLLCCADGDEGFSRRWGRWGSGANCRPSRRWGVRRSPLRDRVGIPVSSYYPKHLPGTTTGCCSADRGRTTLLTCSLDSRSGAVLRGRKIPQSRAHGSLPDERPPLTRQSQTGRHPHLPEAGSDTCTAPAVAGAPFDPRPGLR